jgi:signal peptidase I
MWLSIWLKPGDTIDRVLADNPRHSVWLLAVLGGAANILASKYGAAATTEAAWRLVGGFTLLSAIFALFTVYFQAVCLRWSGKMFGGHATARQLRALMAWGYFLPLLAGSIISLAVTAALHFSTGADTEIFDSLVQIAVFLWSLVILVGMLARVQRFGKMRAIGSGLVGMLLFSSIILLPLGIRAFLFQPFNIPSGAQKPTLLVGDYIFVSKYAYGYSRYSLPFSPPLFSGRIWAAEPQRGDVVVFRLPRDTTTDYIKRVIGLPGDRIQMIDGWLHINDQPVTRQQIEDFIDAEDGKPLPVKQWRETLPNGVSYNTLDLVENGFADNTRVYTVPTGHYFVMGDNRDNSTDSRFSQVGTVPFENLIGRIAIIYYSVAPKSGSAQGAVRFDRIGKTVR